MRNITKIREPRSLTEYRAANPTDYNGYPDKDTLRTSLVAEQRGVCCYCLARIRAEIGSVRIEHWQSHSEHPDLRLVYGNLLGACMGGERERERTRRTDHHCDVYKAESYLSRNPANLMHNVQALVRFLPDGTVTSTNDVFNTELNTVLNLNHPFLVNSRRGVLLGLQKTLEKRGTLTRQDWERLHGEWTGLAHAGELPPFCSVVVYWIEKKLARI
jgi:uncharacterized protein (TIGR02646 family)